jgi:hypothetical protein
MLTSRTNKILKLAQGAKIPLHPLHYRRIRSLKSQARAIKTQLEH